MTWACKNLLIKMKGAALGGTRRRAKPGFRYTTATDFEGTCNGCDPLQVFARADCILTIIGVTRNRFYAIRGTAPLLCTTYLKRS